MGAIASETAALAGLNAMESWDGRGRLASIASPTQIIWGEHDRSYGFAEQEQLWRMIPNCSLAVIPNAAQIAHMDD
jgi:pimeloyl-ACP methyl ester carboxylesterase